MKITRERKVYGALLCLGVLALGVDKFVLGPPDASAQSGANLLIASGPKSLVIAHNKPVVTPPAQQPAEKPLMSLGALAARMRQAGEAQRLDPADARDAFRPPVAWVGSPVAQPVHKTVDAVTPGDLFRQRHHLIALLKSSTGGIAILDGKSVRPGQAVDGFRLRHVGERSATFEFKGESVELQLPVDVQLDPQSITPAGR